MTLLNFVKSATSLVTGDAIKLIVKTLTISIYVVAGLEVSYITILVCVAWFTDVTEDDILSCKQPEFIIQATLLLVVLIIFYYYAYRVTKEINNDSETYDALDENDRPFDENATLVNESRKKAMSNIWYFLIWLSFTAIESFLYAIFSYYMTGSQCQPIHISQSGDGWLEYFDRFMEYQVWFIPLIILYWPTKKRKKENRKRIKAIKSLHSKSHISRDL